MEFKEFTEKISNEIRKYLPEDMKTVDIHVDEIRKLNNEPYHGMSIRKEGASAGIVINLDEAFKRFTNGRSMQETMKDISETLQQGSRSIPDVTNLLGDYGEVKKHLMVRLVGRAQNREMLKTIPHRDVADMALLAYIVVKDDKEGLASSVVNDRLLSQYGVTKEQLLTDAIHSSEELYPSGIHTLGEVLGMPETDDMPKMYVLSNSRSEYGAACISYSGVLDAAAEKLGKDFFVLPSSIHEVLLVPDDGNADITALKQMVHDVNASEVDPPDVLTNNVYHYDSRERIFEQADDFAKRQQQKAPQAKEDRKSVMEELKGRQAVLKEPAKNVKTPHKMRGKNAEL